MFWSLFGFLNEKDRDILFLIFVSRKRQRDVQKILGRSQPSLCYDIKRIKRRLQFIYYLHSCFDIFIDFLRTQTESFSSDEMSILSMMFYTSSFTETAKVLKISQVRVRYSYNKCLKRMEELELWEPYEILTVIRENLNIIRRTYRSESKRKTPLILL